MTITLLNKRYHVVVHPLGWWILVLGAAGLIRLANLGTVELWYDEAFGRLVLDLPFDRMLAAVAGDVHPPLWYALMWIWVRLTSTHTEFMFRLPSVFLSLAALPVAWRIMDRWRISDLGKWAVLLFMAVGPFEIYFGQEARMYAMLQLLFLLGVLAVIEGRTWLLGISAFGLLYTHNYGLFYVAVLLALVLLDNWRLDKVLSIEKRYPFELDLYSLKPRVIAIGIAGILFLPWIVILSGQMTEISSGYWIEPVTLGQLIYTLTIYLFGPFTRQMVLAAALVAVGMLIWALVRRSHKPARMPELALLTFGPLALAVLASLIWRPVYLWRGLIGSAPFLYMLVLPPLVDLPGWKRWYAAVIVVPMLISGLVGYALDLHDFKSTTIEAVRDIRMELMRDDILYSTNDGNWVMFSVYQELPVYLMPQCDPEHDRGALSSLTREALGVQQLPLDQIPHERAWFLWNWGAPTSLCNHDRAAEIVGDLAPWKIYKTSDIQEAGIWRLEK